MLTPHRPGVRADFPDPGHPGVAIRIDEEDSLLGIDHLPAVGRRGKEHRRNGNQQTEYDSTSLQTGGRWGEESSGRRVKEAPPMLRNLKTSSSEGAQRTRCCLLHAFERTTPTPLDRYRLGQQLGGVGQSLGMLLGQNAQEGRVAAHVFERR